MFPAWRQSFQTSKEVYELQNFTNTNRKNYPKGSYFSYFLSSQWHKKSQNTVVTHQSTPYFSSQFFKTFVTHPPNINKLDTVVTPTPVLRP